MNETDGSLVAFRITIGNDIVTEFKLILEIARVGIDLGALAERILVANSESISGQISRNTVIVRIILLFSSSASI